MRKEWSQVESAGRERTFLFQVPLKPTLLHRRSGPGSSHPIKNDWGGAWAGSQPGEGLAIPRQATWALNFSYYSLPQYWTSDLPALLGFYYWSLIFKYNLIYCTLKQLSLSSIVFCCISLIFFFKNLGNTKFLGTNGECMYGLGSFVFDRTPS
jgi:hypothetical protein